MRPGKRPLNDTERAARQAATKAKPPKPPRVEQFPSNMIAGMGNFKVLILQR